jgi:hypothetical protein
MMVFSADVAIGDMMGTLMGPATSRRGILTSVEDPVETDGAVLSIGGCKPAIASIDRRVWSRSMRGCDCCEATVTARFPTPSADNDIYMRR